MTTVQHFLRWFKERSSKRGRKTKNTDWPDVDPSDPSCPRAFMKLPPIPRDVTLSPDISRELCETPSYHVYEEIPYEALDRVIPLDYDPNDPNVDIDDLDFKNAKEFGQFLVVPMRGRVPQGAPCNQGQLKHHRQSYPSGAPDRAQHPANVSRDPGAPGTSPQENKKSQWRDPRFRWIYHDGSQAPICQTNPRPQQPHPCSVPAPREHLAPRTDVRPATQQHITPGSNHQSSRHHVPQPAAPMPTSRQPQNNNTQFTNRMCLGVAALKDPIREQLLNKGRAPAQNTSGSGSHMRSNSDEHQEFFSSDSGINTSQNTTKHSFSDSDVSGVYAMSSGDSLQSHDSSIEVTGSRVPRSDGSNDTFSEYDIKSDDSLVQDELYDFYLSKVKDNLKLKEHVQQIIKSETESSDYEGDSIINGDAVSLTTVTSMSEESLADEEIARLCAQMHRLRKDLPQSSPNDDVNVIAHPKKSSSKKCLDKEFRDRAAKKRERRKKESHSKSKPVEVYELPDFPDHPGSAFQIYKKRHDSPSNSSTYDSDLSEKLSCRATKYQPPPKTKSSKSTSRSNGSTAAFNAPQPNQSTVNRTDRNKLLSDLMRLNHDRQIMVLL